MTCFKRKVWIERSLKATGEPWRNIALTSDFSDHSPNSIPFFQFLDPIILQPSASNPNAQDVYPVWSPPPIPNGRLQAEADWLQGPRYRFDLSPAADMYHRHRDMILNLRRFSYAKELGSPQPFRLTGVMVWNLWRMYSVGLFTIRFEGTKRTPIGDIDQCTQLSSRDFIQRWLALIGKHRHSLENESVHSVDPH